MPAVMVLFYVVSGALTVAVSTAGDLILVHCTLPWLRAVADNVTHGLVGLLCWMMVSGKPLQTSNLLDSLLGGLFACAVDVDHFLAAGSFRIEDATNLKTRPFLHCSSVVLAALSAECARRKAVRSRPNLQGISNCVGRSGVAPLERLHSQRPVAVALGQHRPPEAVHVLLGGNSHVPVLAGQTLATEIGTPMGGIYHPQYL
ncbi:hypothetical protein HPB48_000405 [Haemaphysalis longicornis]|uniref:Transmembrane protein 267 n=1 Tax=Haemaphysalis longicornis TaxID=44386 RepID=A0A9J6GS07_HAELO|nr:hypothetical protein HPB48_000405 [Haemaphysalis longicornis]